MISFLVGSAVVSAVSVGIFMRIHKKEYTNRPIVKDSSLKKILRFFQSFEKGKIQINNASNSMDCYKDGDVTVHTYHRSSNEKWVYIYVQSKRAFIIHYDLTKKKFLKLESETMSFPANELRVFADGFHSFMAQLFSQSSKVDLASLFNESSHEKEEEKSWHEAIFLLSSSRIQQALRHLKSQIEMVHLQHAELDVEEAHRFERLENKVLPDLLETFCQLPRAEQQNREQALMTALLDVTEKVEALVHKIAERKEIDFEKNLELLKQF